MIFPHFNLKFAYKVKSTLMLTFLLESRGAKRDDDFHGFFLSKCILRETLIDSMRVPFIDETLPKIQFLAKNCLKNLICSCFGHAFFTKSSTPLLMSKFLSSKCQVGS